MLKIIKKILNLQRYTSKIDQFLLEYSKTNPKLSLSQQAEIKKYKRIFLLRDKATEINKNNNFFANF